MICKVDGCVSKYLARGYCSKHYYQISRHGKVHMSFYDKNIIREENCIFIMELYNKKCEVIAETIFDGIHIKEIKNHKWHLNSHGYAKSIIYCKHYNLSNFVMGDFSQKYIFDHINRVRLNNLSENLRIATYAQNARNRNMRSDNKSGETVVSWKKDRNKYRVRIKIDGNDTHIGYFTNIQESVAARRQAESKYHK